LKQKFRVYIVIPLLPAFAKDQPRQNVMYYTMSSISKGDGSMYGTFEKQGIKPEEYISFFGMRTHDVLMGRLVLYYFYFYIL
ncbi:unnamed protein product, partial [Didymodactylos carnosus]